MVSMIKIVSYLLVQLTLLTETGVDLLEPDKFDQYYIGHGIT